MFRSPAEPVVLVLGLVLSFAGIVLFAWAMLRLAVLALPLWLGISVFFWLLPTEAGMLVAVLLGLVAGVLAFLLGQLIVRSRLPWPLRAAVAAVFALPAGVAGYSVVVGLMHLGGAGTPATDIGAAIGALVIGICALMNLFGLTLASNASGGLDLPDRRSP